MILQSPISPGSLHVIIVASPPIRSWALEVIQTIACAVAIEMPSAFLAARRSLELPAHLVLLGQEEPCFRLEMGVRLIRQVCPSVVIVGASRGSNAAFVQHFFQAGGNMLLRVGGAPLPHGMLSEP